MTNDMTEENMDQTDGAGAGGTPGDGSSGGEDGAKKLTPEEQASGRIEALQNTVKQLETEIKIMGGRIANCDPASAKEIEAENQKLMARLEKLEQAFFGLIQDAFKPRHADDMKLDYEVLRQATVEFCQRSNINPEIWKNIAS